MSVRARPAGPARAPYRQSVTDKRLSIPGPCGETSQGPSCICGRQNMAEHTTDQSTATHRGVFPEVARHFLSERAPIIETTQFRWAERLPTMERYGALAGRILISMIFVLSGTMKFVDWNGTAASMQKHGMPMINFLLPAAALFELVGGLSVLLGYKSRFGALLLFVFLIPATLIFHAFW